MIYDFDTVVSRVGYNSRKHDALQTRFGTTDLLPMWIADMDLKTAEPIINALKDRVEHGIFGYIHRPDSYFEAISEWQAKRNNWNVDPKFMAFSPSVVTSLSILIDTLTEVGDNILIQSPVYPQFYKSTINNKRNIVKNPLIKVGDRYEVNFNEFEEKLKEGVALFIICNPHNPVGRCWTYEELKRMGELCVKYNTTIISDEIHSDFSLWGNKHIPTASISKEISDITITCTSSTKTFNLAGIHAATTIFPTVEMKEAFDEYTFKLDIYSNNAFSIVANEVAYREGEEWLEQVKTYIQNNMIYTKNYIEENIPKIKAYLPESTYFMWLDFNAFGLSDDELIQILLYDAKVALNECKPYDEDLSGYFRINLACPRVIVQEALDKIKMAFESL